MYFFIFLLYVYGSIRMCVCAVLIQPVIGCHNPINYHQLSTYIVHCAVWQTQLGNWESHDNDYLIVLRGSLTFLANYQDISSPGGICAIILDRMTRLVYALIHWQILSAAAAVAAMPGWCGIHDRHHHRQLRFTAQQYITVSMEIE